MKQEIILVIDNNREIADVTANSILPNLGYQAFVAYGGYQALNLVREHHQKISLMLVDMQMPDLNGLELLRKISKEGYDIPAILVTAHGSEQVAVDAFRLGIQDYLKKPVEIDKLGDAITRALSQSRLVEQKENLAAQLRDQVSWLTALSNVGRSVTSTLNVNTVLKRIVEAGVYLTRADQGFIALADPESDRLFMRAVKNVDEQNIDTLRIPVKDSLVGKAIETSRPIRRTRAAREQGLKVSTGFLVHSLIHVPIIYQERALGVLSVNNHIQSHNFTEKDEAVLTSLADYAAIAIENANSFEQAQQEINERKRIATALRVSEERYALAINGANDGIWDWDLKTDIIHYAPRWKSMLGYEDEEIGDQPDEWFSRIFKDDREHTRLEISAYIRRRKSHFTNEHRMLHKDGSYRWVLCRGMAVWDEDGNAIRMAGSISDITDRKIAEERLLHDAFHDPLTGLANKTLFFDRLSQALLRLKRNTDYNFAVLFMDLDRFKDINDSIGHLVGDHLLIQVAEMLSKGVRSVDTLARFGGDEFIILLDDIKDNQGVMRVADWIQEQFLNPIHVDDHEVFTSTSIGVVFSTPEYQAHEEIIRDADIAMYFAKNQGGERVEIFKPSMRQRVLKRLRLETDLRKAIGEGELRVHYQPIADLNSGNLVGVEALVRWQHPQRGLIYPGGFMPLAEETGIVIDIDRWVLRQACQQIHSWNQTFNPNPTLSVSVNISAKHIATPELRQYVEDVLEETGLASENLKLEITEFSLVDHSAITASAFSNLQNLGVQIQIDDFGIGYSSLGYLSSFPINALKIDRSFVGNIAEDTDQRNIVEAIIGLTERLDVNVIAEGVETHAQLDQLRQLGCPLGQGYLLSTPMDVPDVEELLLYITRGTGQLPVLENAKE
jgi:diguanylate cyclase (GGDEF)-like protein/PAS domain S-box-containing protein